MTEDKLLKNLINIPGVYLGNEYKPNYNDSISPWVNQHCCMVKKDYVENFDSCYTKSYVVYDTITCVVLGI